MATKKTSLIVGERISFKPKAGKRKAGTEEPAKLYGRVDSLVANSMISVTFDDGSKRSLRKSQAQARGIRLHHISRLNLHRFSRFFFSIVSNINSLLVKDN